jgi:hypothetical protein
MRAQVALVITADTAKMQVSALAPFYRTDA